MEILFEKYQSRAFRNKMSLKTKPDLKVDTGKLEDTGTKLSRQ